MRRKILRLRLFCSSLWLRQEKMRGLRTGRGSIRCKEDGGYKRAGAAEGGLQERPARGKVWVGKAHVGKLGCRFKILKREW